MFLWRLLNRQPGTYARTHVPHPNTHPLAHNAARQPKFEQAFRNIDDVLRQEAGCTTKLDDTEQTSWLLF
jgi:hypothetical protein